MRYSQFCCPVGGRPASPRKSHSKSQRGQISGDTQLRRATVEAGQVPSEPSPAMPGDAREVTGGQGVAGSNPAVPTGSRAFSNIFWPHHSQQKSHSLVKWPSQRRAPIMSPGPYQGICQPGRTGETGSQWSKITEPPLSCTAARQPRTPRPCCRRFSFLALLSGRVRRRRRGCRCAAVQRTCPGGCPGCSVS